MDNDRPFPELTADGHVPYDYDTERAKIDPSIPPEDAMFKYNSVVEAFAFDAEGWPIGEDDITRAWIAERRAAGDTPPMIEELVVARNRIEGAGLALRNGDTVYVFGGESESYRAQAIEDEGNGEYAAARYRDERDFARVKPVGADPSFYVAAIDFSLYQHLASPNGEATWKTMLTMLDTVRWYAFENSVDIDEVVISRGILNAGRMVFELGIQRNPTETEERLALLHQKLEDTIIEREAAKQVLRESGNTQLYWVIERQTKLIDRIEREIKEIE